MARGHTLQLGVFFLLAVILSLPAGLAQDPIFFPPRKTKPAEAENAPRQTTEPEAPSEAGEPKAIFFPPVKSPADQPSVAPLTMPADVPTDVVPVEADPAASPVAPLVTDLPRSLKKQLDEAVVPAFKEDRDFDYLQAMGKLISRLDSQGLDSIEQYSQAQGFSIRDHFVSLLAKAIEQQEAIPVPDLKIDVVEYINSGLRRHVESELAELDQHPVMQDPPQLPADWRDCEQLFWEVHVWKNRMTNVARMTGYGVAIQKKLLERAQKRNEIATVNRLQPAEMLNNKVQQHYRTMIEGETSLRIAELEKAEKTLRDSQDFEERIAAAFALELHGDALAKVFAEYPPGSFIRPALNDAGLPERCGDLLASGRDVGSDVVEKAMLLRRGAHWWLRGRYGAGPLVYGLLKSKKALESEDAMFGLYMPKQRPDPVGWVTSDNSIAPGYERRHYYTWAAEKRDLVSKSSTHVAGLMETAVTKEVGKLEQTSFW